MSKLFIKDKAFPSNVKVVPYVDGLPSLLKNTDLIVTRAGASTMSEILSLNLPAIFIPSPYVANNHQYINKVNKSADKLIRSHAKEIGMPIPKNPWIVRKYLWADTENFVSDIGIKLRKIIHKPFQKIVRLAMKNKLIIEEMSELDKNKQYVFVSTHYFTEDVIGLFSATDRQTHMLMGTTDQIENNPLMIAAMLFGFFHVDRMDKEDRKECFEKQNILIEKGTSFINYIGGSWENSENELDTSTDIIDTSNIEARDANGNTPLSNAVYWFRGDPSLINFLLEKGADKFNENDYGVSPYSLAETIANYPVFQYLK